MEIIGAIPNREKIAEDIKAVIIEQYQNRYRQAEGQAFKAMKRATDYALGDIRRRGMEGIADRLTNEIAHEYLMKHRYQRMPALEAFTKAAEEVLEKFANGEIV